MDEWEVVNGGRGEEEVFVVSLQRTSSCKKFSPIIESVVLLVVEVSLTLGYHHFGRPTKSDTPITPDE